jgi:hypothetical protein
MRNSRSRYCRHHLAQVGLSLLLFAGCLPAREVPSGGDGAARPDPPGQEPDAGEPPEEVDAGPGDPPRPDAGRGRPPAPDARVNPPFPPDGAAAPADARAPDGRSAADAPTAPAVYNTPLVCTSGDHWTGGDRGAGNMYPGRPCVACHIAKRGPPFTLAGTVFPTAHEPDDCNGADGFFTGAAIIITDANGMTHTTLANLAGNFYFPAAEKIPFPYKVKLTSNGRERVMVTAQTTADCNACHTVNGDKMAPGRIMLP